MGHWRNVETLSRNRGMGPRVWLGCSVGSLWKYPTAPAHAFLNCFQLAAF
jgi:hypothetical protein